MRARGLTLIEVMIALLVTTIALLGALATVGVTTRGANFSRSATEASVLVQSTLEQLVSLPTGTTGGALPAVPPQPETLLNANGTTIPPGIYTRTTQWTQTAQRRQVTVTVGWTDGLGAPHSVTASRTQDLK
jgi:Tfp pilus assembly protein PilV